MRQISAQKLVQADLLQRLNILEQNIKSNKLETDEMWKTIESVEQTYVELINQKDYDVTPLFNEDGRPPRSPHEKYKKRSDRMDTEEYYITVSHVIVVADSVVCPTSSTVWRKLPKHFPTCMSLSVFFYF